MIITGLEPVKDGPRADVAFDELRRNIYKYGVPVQWEQAINCPCGRQNLIPGDIGAFDTREKPVGVCEYKKNNDCTNGYLYHSKQTIRAIVQDASRDPDRWKLWGEHAAGSIMFTLLPEHLPAFLDRITLLNAVTLYRERKKRSGVVDKLRYPVVHRHLLTGTPENPTIPEEFNASVMFCVAADTNGFAIQTELKEGVDFTITSSGAVDWSLGDTLGTAPKLGAYFSIQYYCHPVYVIRSMPFAFRDMTSRTKVKQKFHLDLPTKALGWLEFLGGDND